jgi:hypothetical protein
MVMLFAGSDYYPCGGWKDFRGYFDFVNDAKKFLLDNWETFDISCCPWAHIVEEDKIVLEGKFDDLLDSSSHQWKFESFTNDTE